MRGLRGILRKCFTNDLPRKITMLFAGIGLLSVVAFTNIKPWVIYGEDHRMDLYQINDPVVLSLADSTAAMVLNSSMDFSKNDLVAIHAKPFGVEFDLCKDETFYSQPNPALCSGFLVGPDLIATAGHCIVDEDDCAASSFVFGLKMNDAQTAAMTRPVSEVYKCKKIIVREQTEEQDYGLIQLERPVVGHLPLKLSEAPAQAQDPVFVIGHPAGLPTKVDGGAHIRSTNQAYFSANLDTYGGNSGSAVFNAVTMEVIGILVRGEQDFTWIAEKGCTGSNICADDECRGEDSTHISYIRKALAAMPKVDQNIQGPKIELAATQR